MNDKIDHTLLKSMATSNDIFRLCQECDEYGFRGVCVPPTYVKQASQLLKYSYYQIATVIGFPLGFHRSAVKIKEAEIALTEGATELDVVWDLGAFLSKEYLRVTTELARIVNLGVTTKVIVESGYLTNEQLKIAHSIVKDSGAQYIKTSTGYSPGADIQTVKLWKKLGGLKIKASGGISTLVTAQEFINNGADIIGTSHGASISKELKRE